MISCALTLQNYGSQYLFIVYWFSKCHSTAGGSSKEWEYISFDTLFHNISVNLRIYPSRYLPFWLNSPGVLWRPSIWWAHMSQYFRCWWNNNTDLPSKSPKHVLTRLGPRNSSTLQVGTNYMGPNGITVLRENFPPKKFSCPVVRTPHFTVLCSWSEKASLLQAEGVANQEKVRCKPAGFTVRTEAALGGWRWESESSGVSHSEKIKIY